MGKRKRKQKGSPRPKPARKKTARTPEQAGPTLQDTIEALRKAALVREEEVILPAEAGAEEPAALAAGLWDRLRRALFTRVRLGRREKALAEILRDRNRRR